MRKLPLLTLAGLVALTSLPAEAQTNPYRRNAPRSVDVTGSIGRTQADTYSPRAATPYAHSPSYRGTVRWDTPNADGNFGGPGGGGSAGSSGG